MVRKRKSNEPKMQWYKADLHLHTPASSDWQEPGVTFLDWLYAAEAKEVDIVAITDHNTVAGVARLRQEMNQLEWLERHNRIRPSEKRILDEYRRLGNKILVLPGFEFTATLGFHILGIFPPDTSVRELEFLLLSLNIPPDKLDSGSMEVGATADVLTAYRKIREAGGIVIAAHANAAHGVALAGVAFGGQTKIAYTQDPNLHALEVTDLESRSQRATARFFDGSKAEYPRRMHCIQGSDAHRLEQKKERLGIGDRTTELYLPEPTFEAIKELFEGDDFSRTRPCRKRRRKPKDPILAARIQGSSETQSFHEQATMYGGHLYAVLKDVAAFANRKGGTVYVGVSDNPRSPAWGVPMVENTLKTIQKDIQRRIVPPVSAEAKVMESQGQQVISITVREGKEKPYTLDIGNIFVRKGTETVLANRDEIIALVKEAAEPKAKQVPSEGKKSGNHGKAASEEPKAGEKEPEHVVPKFIQTPPNVGVEIVGREKRKGRIYYAVRDLRNDNIVHNVTKSSARRLWQYAIAKYEEDLPLDKLKITWRGDIGLVRSEDRAKKRRYDLAQRDLSGNTHVYYGVTDDGVSGEWEHLIQSDKEREKPDTGEGIAQEEALETEAQQPAVE